MVPWWVPIVAALVTGIGAATPGILALRGQSRRDALASREADREDRAERRGERADAVEGFAELTEALRKQISDEKRECQEEIGRVRQQAAKDLRSVKRELLERIESIEGA